MESFPLDLNRWQMVRSEKPTGYSKVHYVNPNTHSATIRKILDYVYQRTLTFRRRLKSPHEYNIHCFQLKDQ